jgi:hypothetical protein
MDVGSLERMSPGDWFHDVRDQLKWHVYRRSERAFDAGDSARDALQTPDQVTDRQRQIREFFIASLGGLPADDGPVEARCTGVVTMPGYRIERLVYPSRPGSYVTSLLYVPDGLTEPAPAVLFLCGHAEAGKAYPEYQRVCQLMAHHGFVVLAQDPIGQGERLSYYDPRIGAATVAACTLEHDHAGAQCVPLGWAMARFFLHDARRSLDYLASRPEVDPSRIGLTGNSGGGTQSCLLMLTDERIAAAAPGTFIMDRRSYMYSGGAQDAEQIWPGFTAAGYDHEDVLIAMAPKPVCVLAVTDDFFPIEGTRRTVERCRRVWRCFGVEGLPELVVDHSGHAYTPVLATAAVRFFAKHLMGRDVLPDYAVTRALPEAEIRCTKSGQVRGDFGDARGVFEVCADRARELESARKRIPAGERRLRAREWLDRHVRTGRVACDLNPRTYWTGRIRDLEVHARVWWSQPDLLGHGLAFSLAGTDRRTTPWTIALWDDGTNRLGETLEQIRSACLAGQSVLVLDVSGMGALAPHPLLTGTASDEFYGVIHKLTDDLIWLGDSLCALRTYDVLRAVDLLTAETAVGTTVRVLADSRFGRQCIYGYLAAMIDERIETVESVGPPPRWFDWVCDRLYDSRNVKSVLLPGALKYFEIAED